MVSGQKTTTSYSQFPSLSALHTILSWKEGKKILTRRNKAGLQYLLL